MRALTFVAALALAGPVLAEIQTGRSEFEVTRNGEPFGRHVVNVTRQGDAVRADVAIDLAAKVGPVTAYSYRHRCTEVWRGEALQSLDCTDREGRKTASARAVRDGGALRVTGSAFTGSAGDVEIPSSWWNEALLRQSRVIDTRTGGLMPLRIRRVGVESINAGGQAVRATRYRIEGTIPADAWYDAEGRWVKLAFTARGQNIVYRKVTPVAGAPRA